MSIDLLPPVVGSLPARSHPAIPSGMKVACFTGPSSPEPDGPSENCPVVQWGGLTFWPYSYVDNRIGMGIVAYDSAGSVVQEVQKSGARYVWKITVDAAAKTVTFWGQANQTIVVPWVELAPAPAIASLPANSHPAIPGGMKMACFTGPSSPEPDGASPNCPVVRWVGLTFWPYSYVDNRVSMGIVAYDSAGKVVHQEEGGGARYVWKITEDKTAKTITFWGQANQTIVAAWA
jgi:hypothetical protein